MDTAHELKLRQTLTSDRTADGRFIVGVLTTGIFCLPSCRARKPKPENVRFFGCPEEATAAGLRPCKRCRPGDFYRDHDPDRERIERLVTRVRSDVSSFGDVSDLVSATGTGTSKLHALFRQHYHTTPAQFLGRARVVSAADALLTTSSSVTDIAFAVGFETLSAFHARFRRHLRVAPGEYRRLADGDSFTVTLPTSFQRQRVLAYIGRDPNSTTERADAREFALVGRSDDRPFVVRVELLRGRAHCRVETASRTAGVAVTAHRQVLAVLGLHLDPAPFERRVLASDALGPLITGRRGLTIPQTRNLFEGLVWVIAGQQVSLNVAMMLRRRLTERIGMPVGGGFYAQPTVEDVAQLEPSDLQAIGFSVRKSEYLVDVARAVVSGALDLPAIAGQSAGRIERAFNEIRGLGTWSTQYLMMRSLGFADCVPIGDAALARGLERFFKLPQRPGSDQTHELLAPFAPYRSLATFHIWSSLQENPQ